MQERMRGGYVVVIKMKGKEVGGDKRRSAGRKRDEKLEVKYRMQKGDERFLLLCSSSSPLKLDSDIQTLMKC